MNEDKRIDDKCVWHENKSLESRNEWINRCFESCDGYNHKCDMYLTLKQVMEGKYGKDKV